MFFSKTDDADLDGSGSTGIPGVAAVRARAAGKAAQIAANNAAIAARNAAASAAALAQIAAQNAGSTAQAASGRAQFASSRAQTVAAGASQTAKLQMDSARRWMAPQLESAADYCTTTIAPRVSSALRSTASQVRPVEAVPARRKLPSALTWGLLGTAILAALGAVAALVRYRYSLEMASDSESADLEDMDEAPRPGSPDVATTDPSEFMSKPTALPNQTSPGTDTSVNGRVSTNEW